MSKKTIACPNVRCVNGATIEYQYLEKLVFLLLMAGDSQRRGAEDRRHPYFDALDELIGLKGCPNASMAELTGGLAERPPSVFGHDVMDRHKAVKKIIKAAGLPKDWGNCPTCKGHEEIEV